MEKFAFLKQTRGPIVLSHDRQFVASALSSPEPGGEHVVLTSLPDPEDETAWVAFAEREIFVDANSTDLARRAMAAGCKRVATFDFRRAAGDLTVAEIFAEARRQIKGRAVFADPAIVLTMQTSPRPIDTGLFGRVGQLLNQAADHAGTSRDFVAALAIPALCGITGGNLLSCVTASHRQPVIIHAGAVGLPGANKTGAARALEIAKRACEKHVAELHQMDLALWEARGAEKSEKPSRPLIRLANATAEAAMFALSRQSGGLELQNDELALVLPQLGASGYSASAPLAGLWLRGFDGGRYDYSRRTASDEPLVIENFATAVSFCAQPDVLADYVSSPRRDGGPDRFLFAFPDRFEPEVPTMPIEQVEADLAAAWVQIYQTARDLATLNPITGDAEVRVPWTEQAVSEFERWRKSLMALARDMSVERQSARMKTVSHLVRLAALGAFTRHAVEGAELVVTDLAVWDAIAMIRGFLDHRHKVERFCDEPVRERRARELARAIVRRGVYMLRPAEIRRDWRLTTCRTENDLKDALIELHQLGWVKEHIGPRDQLPPIVNVNPTVAREAAELLAQE